MVMPKVIEIRRPLEAVTADPFLARLPLGDPLPDEYDSAAFHLDPELLPTIERGSAAMAALIAADTRR